MHRPLAIFGTLMLLALAGAEDTAVAKYYKYRDENGVLHFVDDSATIPDHVIPNMETVAEPWDHLSDEEKKARMEREQERIRNIRKESKEQLNRFKRQQRMEEEMQRERDEERRRRQLSGTTPIDFINNSIYINATITYKGRSHTLRFILDTGASITVVYGPAAKRIGLETSKAGKALLAGGKKAKVRVANVDAIAIGPRQVKGPKVMVFGYDKKKPGYDGLLGMDFLRHFPHVIDTKKKVIIWTGP